MSSYNTYIYPKCFCTSRCVTAADDNLAIVWDIQFGYKLVTLCGHSRPINSMILLPTGSQNQQRLATGSSDKQIRVRRSSLVLVFEFQIEAIAILTPCSNPFLEPSSFSHYFQRLTINSIRKKLCSYCSVLVASRNGLELDI